MERKHASWMREGVDMWCSWHGVGLPILENLASLGVVRAWCEIRVGGAVIFFSRIGRLEPMVATMKSVELPEAPRGNGARRLQRRGTLGDLQEEREPDGQYADTHLTKEQQGEDQAAQESAPQRQGA